MTGTAVQDSGPHRVAGPDRAFGLLVLLGIVGSLFTAAATVPMGLAALYALGARLSGRRADPDVARLFWIFLACYAALLATDLLNGGAIGNFQFTAVNYLPLLGAAGVAFVLRRADLSDRAVATALVAAIAIATVVGLFRWAVWGVVRPGGLSINPIPYGLVIGMWGMLLLALALEARRGRWPLLLVAMMATVPILLTGSKIVWLAVSAAYTLVVLRWGVAHRQWRWLAGAALAAVLLASAAYLTVAHERVAGFVDEISLFLTNGDRSGASFGHRAILAEAGLRAFLDGPVLGYGFLEQMDVVRAYVDPSGPDVSHLTHLHNDYLTHLVAFGYVGGAFLLVFFATLIWIARNAADAARRSAAYAFALMAAIYMVGEIFLNIEPVTGPAAIMIGLLMMRPRPPDPA